MFDNLSFKAYGEKSFFSDICQIVVRGSNQVIITMPDESLKDEILKALSRSEYELESRVEGKNIHIKLGTTKKDIIEKATKQMKKELETFNLELRGVRHEVIQSVKKLEKVISKEQIKILENQIKKEFTKFEEEGKQIVKKKEKDIASS